MVWAITRRELLGGGRTARWYVLRAGFLAVLCLVTIPSLFALAEEMRTTPGFRAFSAGKGYALLFAALLMTLVALLAPALSITAVASEKASGVLELLEVSGVRSYELIAGKLVARVGVLATFIASAVPLLAVTTVMGGSGAELIALIAAYSFAIAVLGTAIGLLASSLVRATVPALVLAYGATAAAYVPALLYASMLAERHAIFSKAAGAPAPPELAIALLLSAPIALGEFATGSIGSWLAWGAAVPPILLGAGIALAAVPFARPAAERTRAERFAEKGIAALEAPLGRAKDRTSRRVIGNPVAWREARSHRFGFGVRLTRLLYVSLGGAVALHLLVFAVIGGYHELAGAGVAFLSLGGAAVALVVASTSIATERETRALPLLTISRMSAGDILLGKVEGLWLFLWPVAVLPVVPAIAFLGIDSAAFLTSVALTVVLLAAATGIGLFFSAFARKPAAAVWSSLVSTGAWISLVPLAISAWCRGRCVGEANAVTLLNPIATVVDLTTRFARTGTRSWHVDLVDPWVPYAALALLVGVTAGCLALAGWRLSWGGDA